MDDRSSKKRKHTPRSTSALIDEEISRQGAEAKNTKNRGGKMNTTTSTTSPSFSSAGFRVGGVPSSQVQQGMILIDVLDKVKMLTSLVKEFSVEQLDLRLQVSRLQQQQEAIEKIVTTAPSTPHSTPATPTTTTINAPFGAESTTTNSKRQLSSEEFPFAFPLSANPVGEKECVKDDSSEDFDDDGIEGFITTPSVKRQRLNNYNQPPMTHQTGYPLRLTNRFNDFTAAFIPFCIDDANKPFTVARPTIHLSAVPSLISKDNRLARVIVSEAFCKLLECNQEEMLGEYATDSMLAEEPTQLVQLSVRTRGLRLDKSRGVSPVFTLQPKFQTRKGTIVQTSTKNQMFYDEQGYLSFIIVMVDKAEVVGYTPQHPLYQQQPPHYQHNTTTTTTTPNVYTAHRDNLAQQTTHTTHATHATTPLNVGSGDLFYQGYVGSAVEDPTQQDMLLPDPFAPLLRGEEDNAHVTNTSNNTLEDFDFTTLLSDPPATTSTPASPLDTSSLFFS